MNLLTRFTQLIIILIPFGIFYWLLNQWMIPSGVFTAQHTVGESSPFVDELQPSDRVGDVIDGAQALVDDPVFFFVHPHREFKSLDLEVWFQNDELPIVELGGLARTNPDVYDLKPLHNILIEESNWNRVDNDGMVLLQRESTYASVSDFLANPPSRDDVATYRASLDIPYRIEDYRPTGTSQTIDVSLRGHHEFKTYIKDETLAFNFFYMDMNRDEGEDIVRITVFNENDQPVAEVRGSDDGNTSTDGQPGYGLQELNLRAYGLEEGVYKVVMNAPRDIFFRQITTSQQKVVFLNMVYIGDEVGYREPWEGATIYTESPRVQVQTRHAEGVQTLTAGEQVLEVEEPYEWYTLTRNDLNAAIDIPVGDVEVVVDGKIAFSESQYFNPDPVSLSAFSSIEDLGVDYVYATYTSPREEGEWLVGTVSFDTAGLYTDDDTWKFSFSTPGIVEKQAKLTVHQVNAIMYRPTE